MKGKWLGSSLLLGSIVLLLIIKTLNDWMSWKEAVNYTIASIGSIALLMLLFRTVNEVYDWIISLLRVNKEVEKDT